MLCSPRLLRNPTTLLIDFALCVLVSGCASKAANSRNSHGVSRPGVEVCTYTDGIGRQVTLAKHPERIISLAPSVTELIYLLGADGRLVGVTSQCDWPDSVRSKPRIGDLLNPNYEVILAAHPDLVIASTAGNDRAAVFKLADLGLPVYVTAPRNVQKIFETVEAVGRITDCAARGVAVVSRMKERLADIKRRLAGLPPVRAFFITWFDPLLTPGKETFETDLLRLAGVESISANVDQYYPRFSLEQVVARDPDVIITVNHEGSPLPDLRRLAGWQRLRAVRQGKIYVLNEVFQHPSPRFVDGVEEMARRLHPERFR